MTRPPGIPLNQRNISTQETEINQLKRLVYKYPEYHRNPDEIIKRAVHWSINGDDTFLEDKLAHFIALTV
jgi:hypothetical protein